MNPTFQFVMQNLTTFLIGGGVGGGILGYGIKRWVDDHFDRKNRAKIVEGITKAFNNAAAVDLSISHLAQEVKASRIMVLYAENGGGIPDAGKPLYTSTLYEHCSADLLPIRTSFQRQPLDQSYTRIMRSTLSQEFTWVNQGDLPNGCFLRDVYVNENVKDSLFAKVGIKPDKVYYLTVIWSEDSTHDTVQVRGEVRRTVNLIRELLEIE